VGEVPARTLAVGPRLHRLAFEERAGRTFFATSLGTHPRGFSFLLKYAMLDNKTHFYDASTHNP
jgi:hypothetical protein